MKKISDRVNYFLCMYKDGLVVFVSIAFFSGLGLVLVDHGFLLSVLTTQNDKTSSFFLLLVVFMLSLIWTIVTLLRRIFYGRISIMAKQFLILLPLAVISIAIGSERLYQFFDQKHKAVFDSNLASLAGIGSTLIRGEIIEEIQSSSDREKPAFFDVAKAIENILNEYRNVWKINVSAAIYAYRDGKIYFIKSLSNYYGVQHAQADNPKWQLDCAQSGQIKTAEFFDESGKYLTVVTPIRNLAGKIVGVFEVYKNASIVEQLALDLRLGLLKGLLCSVLVMLAMLLAAHFFFFSVSGPASTFKSQTFKNRKKDRLFDLNREFNSMGIEFGQYFTRLTNIRDANAHFVPIDSLAFLGQQSPIDIRLGQQIRMPMTVFFVAFQSIASLSESTSATMSAEDHFGFINDFLGIVGPLVRENGGFIDCYLGDAILAFFPRSANDAVDTTLSMSRSLQSFNKNQKEHGKREIDFGIGIHSDQIILGVIGDEQHLVTSTVSNATDIAKNLAVLNKTYGCTLIASKSALQVTDDAHRELFKFLTVIIKNGESTAIYGI